METAAERKRVGLWLKIELSLIQKASVLLCGYVSDAHIDQSPLGGCDGCRMSVKV